MICRTFECLLIALLGPFAGDPTVFGNLKTPDFFVETLVDNLRYDSLCLGIGCGRSYSVHVYRDELVSKWWRLLPLTLNVFILPKLCRSAKYNGYCPSVGTVPAREAVATRCGTDSSPLTADVRFYLAL